MKTWTRTASGSGRGCFSPGPGPGAPGGPRRKRATGTTQTVCGVRSRARVAGTCGTRGRGSRSSAPPPAVCPLRAPLAPAGTRAGNVWKIHPSRKESPEALTPGRLRPGGAQCGIVCPQALSKLLGFFCKCHGLCRGDGSCMPPAGQDRGGDKAGLGEQGGTEWSLSLQLWGLLNLGRPVCPAFCPLPASAQPEGVGWAL